MDDRVNCMTCLTHPDDHLPPGVFVDQDNVTHALCATGFGKVFRLCDFDQRSGVLIPGRWGHDLGNDQITTSSTSR